MRRIFRTEITSQKRSIFNNNIFRRIVKFLPKTLGKKLPREIKVIDVQGREARRLNFVYRGKNESANVLSFRYGPDYGEILICPEIIRQEAKKQGHSFKYQMTWMILHGMIHLAGVHHEKSQAMAQSVILLESQVLERLGLRKSKIQSPNVQSSSKSKVQNV